MLNVNNNEKRTGAHTTTTKQNTIGERDKGKGEKQAASGNGKHTGKHY